MIKVIFVDIDNTLLDFDKCAAESIKQNCIEHGLKFSPSLINTFLSTNNMLWNCLERGDITLDELHEVRWNLIFAKLDIKIDGVEFESHFRTLLAASSIQVDGAMDFLEYLTKRYTVCAASNGPYGQQCFRLEKAGMAKFFHKVFVSEKAGHNKPSKDFFDYCFKELKGTRKEETVLIGDSPTADIAGGVAYGLKTIWFNHDQLPQDSVQGCDYVIYSLSEIVNIL